jgi:hypothetical protein
VATDGNNLVTGIPSPHLSHTLGDLIRVRQRYSKCGCAFGARPTDANSEAAVNKAFSDATARNQTAAIRPKVGSKTDINLRLSFRPELRYQVPIYDKKTVLFQILVSKKIDFLRADRAFRGPLQVPASSLSNKLE